MFGTIVSSPFHETTSLWIRSGGMVLALRGRSMVVVVCSGVLLGKLKERIEKKRK